jgi:hypothetical protein
MHQRIASRPIATVAFFTLALLVPAQTHAADARGWDAEKKEEFLKTAQIVKTYSAKKGVTGTLRVTLSDGQVTHDASIQTIDEHKQMFQPDNGPPEMNFVDSYRYNVAAWKLAKMLGLADMTPTSVERNYKGNSAAFTWWVDDVMMDEGDRKNKKLNPPNQEDWNREMNTLLVFDQLIYNTDRNVGNIVIDKGWHIWMIDHTRAFRTLKTLRTPKVLTFCDRNLLAKMKTLDESSLKKILEPYVSTPEIQGMLARRDLIVSLFESKGESSLFDRPARN